MKMYKKTTEVIERSVLVTRECDLCHKKAKGSDWNAGIYEIDETEISITIKQKKGDQYPEGGYGTEYEIDLCPECFINRLIPWLKSEGATIEECKWIW